MSALGALLACALLAPLAAPRPEGGEPSAAWRTIPSEVEVGEPFRWLVEVRHPEGALRALDEQLAAFAAGLDPAWALLSTEPALSTVEADGWVRRRAGWTAASLEPGERELPELTIRLADGRSVTTAPATIEVAGVLADGEDEPRPPRGFRELPPEPEGAGAVWLALLAGGVLAAVAAFALLRRRRRAAAPREETDEERLLRRLAALEESLPSETARVRELFYELSALLRGALDERAGRDRRGLTDEEWKAAVQGDEALPPAGRAALERFLARCGEIKYAAAAPTPWAVREDLESVREVIGRGARDDGENGR